MGVSPILAKYLIEHNIQITDIKINPTKQIDSKKSYIFDIFDTNKGRQRFNLSYQELREKYY